MANAQKYTRAACGHLAAHYERKKDEKGEYIKFGNQDIDPQATRRVAAKQYQDLDSVIADAQRRAQKLPDISHIKQRGGSYDGPEF